LNRTLRQAKSIQGEMDVPSSYHEAASIALPALFAAGETVIRSLPKCQGMEALYLFLRKHFGTVSREGTGLTILGSGGFTSPSLPPQLEMESVPDLVESLAPLFFGRGVKILCPPQVMTRRFQYILKKLDAAGFMLNRSEVEGKIQLELVSSSPDSVAMELDRPDEAAKVACLFALIAGATGESKIIEATPLPGDCESLLKRMGAEIQVHRKGGEMTAESPEENPPTDELEKRIRRLQAKKETSAEKPLKVITVKECKALNGATFDLQGDLLLAAPFLLATTLLNQSSLTLRRIGGSAMSGFLLALRRMGAQVKSERLRDADAFDLQVESAKLMGRRLSGELTANIGEMFPFVAVAAAFAQGQTLIRDATFLHDGPTDLIEGTIANLKAMGAKVGEIEDGIVIEGAKEYDGAEFDSFGHPAMAMAFSAAAVKNKGESVIQNAEAVDFLWPDFYFKLESALGQGK
jgi:5-enolpyruvylshikimate-3-phosphate synthase